GRTFTFRLRELLRGNPEKRIFQLSSEAKEDLRTWLEFLDSWNGSYDIIRELTFHQEDIGLFTDASDYGMGGVCFEAGEWFTKKWTAIERQDHIGVREMKATIHAIERWANHWAGRTIVVHTDNKANVETFAARRARTDAAMAGLLRTLFRRQ